MSEQAKNLEILAPAGSREAFFAAIHSGADAVYLAGKQFGARAYAANFDLDELCGLLRYAHLRGVSVYVAVNTLLKDAEFSAALEFCRRLYEIGADALIVQDIGLAAELAAAYPQLPLNASTQMTLHNSAGVRFMERFGFRRAILAREVSLSDIRAVCAATDMQIEVFAHGALCICFSGQCLFSSLIGGRSGNRGRCAQPCRLQYELLDKQGNVAATGHLLSPRDLNTIDLLPELAEAGVVSLKLEGRMKRPEYVAAVTAAYAAAKLGEKYDAAALAQAFNRGFTKAYLTDNPGAEMMSYDRPNNRGTRLGRIESVERDALVLRLDAPLAPGDGVEIWVSRGGRQGFEVKTVKEVAPGRVLIPLAGIALQVKNLRLGDRVFKTYDRVLAKEYAGKFIARDDLPLRLHFVGRQGERPHLTAYYKNVSAEATADYIIPPAQNRPADWELLQKQFGRLGGSGWHLTELAGELATGVMLPASVLNNLRREALQALEDKLLAPWRRDKLPRPHMRGELTACTLPPKKQAKLAAAVDGIAQAEAAVAAGADIIYWCGWRWRFQSEPGEAELRYLAGLGERVLVMLPTIALEDELPLWRRRLKAYQEAGFAGIVAANPWAFTLLAEQGWHTEIVAGQGLNCLNKAAAMAYGRQGVNRVTMPAELNAGEISALALALPNLATEMQVFGNMRVMQSRHCPIGALLGGKTAAKACSGACRSGGFWLRDAKGFEFPVYTDEFCRSHIYNGHQLCLLEETPRLSAEHDVLFLDLFHYPAEQAAKIVAVFEWARHGAADADLAAAKERLIALTGRKLTKGHYYRGVE
ncbi:MAG TPA: U32 family peptidase [Candidatus Avidehalobacter gallistercoris]|uniref:U32 family peptidase n=1 Tax=Candidatus Avidehalobacter gallistercoris TaxID=2840694 RepID=A0A9D1HKR2_9FIRM|nr:U32 family peptidase [Candidatus Avidehalobacter gallistercoris]